MSERLSRSGQVERAGRDGVPQKSHRTLLWGPVHLDLPNKHCRPLPRSRTFGQASREPRGQSNHARHLVRSWDVCVYVCVCLRASVSM